MYRDKNPQPGQAAPLAEDGTPLEVKEGIVLNANADDANADTGHRTGSRSGRTASPHSAFVWRFPNGSGLKRARGGSWLTLALLPIIAIGVIVTLGGIVALALAIGLVVFILRAVFGRSSPRY
ncbi:MAG TPA: hypothetical protein DCS07_01255 [Bdellovibrionales bacterium]|nr:MAG: hypothetical protein A2Z97_01595 [Bdellovibrionales bacterium GWB1_52_6]OFZ05033.1 MAG: hypothetical protein A2X97_00355 [Bdellovibrionales bacterium GWA1_52_35]OFZ43264.1 MAG: hypothetical protein A2070_12830 [Bdellovibrionales bacterium GWC1_52_8]HAR41254.1 hypothetical protein [Bdellovibrionales bacterium]HCM41266.1 hypothetical protein [Bdellovibrionales bacterium]